MNESFCSLLTLTHEYVLIRCHPLILLWQLEREGQFLWEDLKDEEHGILKENVKQQGMMPIVHGHIYGAEYSAIIHQCFVYLSLMLYASWCCFCQAVAVLCAKLKAQDMGTSSCTTLLFPIYDLEPLNFTMRNDISLTAFIEARQ